MLQDMRFGLRQCRIPWSSSTSCGLAFYGARQGFDLRRCRKPWRFRTCSSWTRLSCPLLCRTGFRLDSAARDTSRTTHTHTPRHATPRHATPRHATPRHTTPQHHTTPHDTTRHKTHTHTQHSHITQDHTTSHTPYHATQTDMTNGTQRCPRRRRPYVTLSLPRS